MNQLAEHNIKVICIIPAAGNSSRFKSGNKLNAFGQSKRGTKTKDTYSLNGFAQAFNKINDYCS